VNTATRERMTFTTSRLLEFFTVKELQMQIGHDRNWWPTALVKELIDNALDACETAGIAPEIAVTVEPDAVSVGDNGPGLPRATLGRSLPRGRARVTRRGTFYPPRYTAWLESVHLAAVEARAGAELLAGDVAVVLRFVMPDRRRADIDNLCKGVLDGLAGAAYVDDAQVTALAATVEVGQPAGAFMEVSRREGGATSQKLALGGLLGVICAQH
jgi:Holliday junction resolvase RusA-like endonuclease